MRTPKRRRLLPILAVLLLGSLSPSQASASPPEYTFDVDPIRLGNKALEEGRLDEAATRFAEAVTAGYQIHKADYGLAEIAVREGRYARADTLYREALRERVRETGKAKFPEAHAGLGLVLLRRGMSNEAQAEFRQALAEKEGFWPAVYGQALLRLDEGKWEEAKTLLDRGAKTRGVKEGEDRYHFGMALYHLGREDFTEAENEALVAFSLAPWDPEYGTVVARIYEMRDVPDLAIDAYLRALATPGMRPTAALLRSLGGLYRKVQRYNEARDAYLQAVAVDSTYAPALKDLADLFGQANQPENAAKVLLSYLRLEPRDADALVSLSAAALETRNVNQALEAARQALAVDSTRADTRLAFARAGIRSGDPAAQAEAAEMFSALPDTAGPEAEDLVLLGTHEVATKQYDRAATTLARARLLAPDSPDVRFQLGMLELRTGRPDSAAARLEEALVLAPESALYALNLGVAYLQAGRNLEAIRPLRTALGVDAALTIGRVLLGQALIMSDSLSAAETEYRKVIEVEPANAKALRGLGFCHIRRSNYGAAVTAYRAAADADPGNADGWAGLGTAYLGQRNWDAAESALRKAKSIDPGNTTARKSLELLEQARSGQ